VADSSGASTTPRRSANESGRAIARNMLVSYANLARATLIGILVTPLLLKALGETAFGVWSLVLGASGYVALVDAGIATALVARVAAAEARGDSAEIAGVFRSGQALLIALAALGALVLAAITLGFNVLFSVPQPLEHSAQVAMLLLGISTLVTIAGTSWTAALVGIGRVDVVSIAGFVTTTTLAVGQVVLAMLGAGLQALAAASLAISLITVAITRRLSRRHLAGLPPVKASRRTAVSLLSLGTRNGLVGITTIVAFSSDVLIVGAIAGPVAAAAYAVASRAAAFARSVATSASDVLAPTFGHAAAKEDAGRVRLLFRSSVLVSLLIATPLAVILATLSGPLLDLWLGSSPAGASVVLAALGALMLLQLPGGLVYVYLMGAQKSNVLLKFSLPAAAINLLASIVLTKWLGPVGPALGSLIATALVDPLLLRHMARRVMEVRTRDLLRDVLSVILVPLIGAILLAVVVKPIASDHPMLSPVAALAIEVTFVGVALLWLRISGAGAMLGPAVRIIPRVGGKLERILVGTPSATTQGVTRHESEEAAR
jgi:O-antigen/teichoic acid export membrane protein